MEWKEEKDVFMLREMLGSNVFAHKKGSPARGLAWEAIVLTLNGLEYQETASEAKTESKQQEKEMAENMRKKAMESLGQMNKRKFESKDGSTGKEGKWGRCAKPLTEFLREKSEADREIRQQELEIRKQEQQSQRQLFQTLLQNQQQMNGMILAVV